MCYQKLFILQYPLCKKMITYKIFKYAIKCILFTILFDIKGYVLFIESDKKSAAYITKTIRYMKI